MLDNMRVISTVMGEDSIDNRNEETKEMLDYAYNNYSIKKYISKDNVLKRIKDRKSHSNNGKNIEIVPIKDINILVKKTDNLSLNYRIKINKLKSNIKVGQKVGVIEITNNNKIIDKTYLTVKKNVRKVNVLKLYLSYLKDILNGNMDL